MGKDSIIRIADERDLEELEELERLCFLRPWTRESLSQELGDQNQRVVVKALLDGQVVGYAALWIIVDEGHITRIAVHPQHRRKGVGKELVRALMQHGTEGGCVGFTLEVREGNRAARAMYESLGFRAQGKRPGYYEEEREDGIIMWWIPDWNQTEPDGKGVGR